MVYAACEMVWLKNLLAELGFQRSEPMPMHLDIQSDIYIAQNMYSINEPSTLRLTVISSEILGPRRLLLSSSHSI